MAYYNNIKTVNRFKVKNCVNHELAVYSRDDLITDRMQHAHAKPGAKPKIIIHQEYPLSVNTYGLPEAIDDDMHVLGTYQEFQLIQPIASEWQDIMVVSLKYWLGITKALLKNDGTPAPIIHPLFIDRLWLPEPVSGSGFGDEKRKIGCYLEKAMRPLRPDVYVRFLRSDPRVQPSLAAVRATLNCYPENRQPDAMTPYIQELQQWYNEMIQGNETPFHTTPATVKFEA